MGYDGKLKFDTKIDESGFNAGIDKLGTLAKSGLAVLGSYVASFAVLTKSAVDEVGRLEQNVGGIETLFGAGGKTLEEYAKSIGKTTDQAKESYEKLMQAQTLALDNADKAYETAGLSANEYMSTVTSFAAALKQSVSDEVEAAKAADQAVIDMSDNANKMGTSMESIQNAYQGFAKQNYTMLDNLKLGYGGTKEEMKRLLEDAEKLSGVEYDINNLADVYEAIHVIQTELGITGTTAKEAATTIEGSMNSAKAAWDNFLAGTASPEELAKAVDTAADVMVDNLAVIVPRLAETIPEVVQAIVPTVLKSGPILAQAGLSIMEDFVAGAIEIIPQLPAKAGEVMATLMDGIQENAPGMIDTGANMLAEFIRGIGEQVPALVPKALETVVTLADALLNNIPIISEAGANMLAEFIEGIGEQLPELVPQALQMVVTLADAILSNMPTIINAGISLLKGLAQGLIESLPILIAEGPRIINDFADAIYAGVWELLKAGGEMLLHLLKGIWENVPLLLANAGEIFMMLINIFSLSNLFSLGKKLIQNLINGIKNLGPNMVKTGGSIVEFLVNGIKNLATHPITTLKNIASNAMKTIKGLDWKSIGTNIIKGIANGLKKGVSTIVNAAKDAAGAALSAAKKFLGIKSPSTRFRDEVGKYMAQGIGVGFEKNMPVDDMSGTLSDSVQKMQQKVAVVTQTTPLTNVSAMRDVTRMADNVSEDGSRREIVIHTHVDLDGKEVGDSVTRVVDSNFSDDEELKRRGN